MNDPHDLQVGDRIKDNDPRMHDGNRVLTVVTIRDDKVDASCGVYSRVYAISRRRIFTDGKPRRYGFNKVIS